MNQKTMKAVVYHGPGKISFDDVPVPVIKEPTDAILKVTTSTICGTDIHIEAGGVPSCPPGTILGHEFCGEVVELGTSVKNFKVGDKVAVSCVSFCGECFWCLRGNYARCANGSWILGHTINGCQAEFCRVPYAHMSMKKIPKGLTDEDVLFVTDILSTGFYGAQRGMIKPGDTVAVMGGGPVGICAMVTARLWGPARVIAVDSNDFRLEVAKKNGAADVGINPAKEDAVAKIKELTDGRGADVTIEAVGFKPTFDLAIDAVRPGGTVSLLGVFEGPMELKMQELWIKNIYISMGLVDMNNMDQLINLIATGKINMKFLQTHVKPLNDIMEGYDVFGKKKDNVLKWLVKPYKA
jgi:alcohol dehydrogenase